MKLLIITRNAWNESISTGNTMSNFFSEWDGDIANLYCRDEIIDNRVCSKYYKITEWQLAKSIIKGEDAGKYFELGNITAQRSDIIDTDKKNEKRAYDFFRSHRWTLFLWGRELLWELGRWKNENLNAFLCDYSPDLILIPLYDCFYMYKILFYVHQKTDAKVVLYTGDDMYTLKQFSLSPLYWVDRFIRRGYIRRAVKISSYRFCLCEMQSMEYSRIFNTKFSTHMKGILKIDEYPQKEIRLPIIVHYAGNLFPGRWKTILMIGKEIRNLNKGNQKICFNLYTSNTLNRRIKKQFNKYGINLNGSVSRDKLAAIQKEADILLHVECFGLRDKLKTRLSISTKIIDYFSAGKTILAVGPKGVASMEYLESNGLALIANDKETLRKVLKNIIDRPEKTIHMSRKQKDYIQFNHNVRKIRTELYSALSNL